MKTRSTWLLFFLTISIGFLFHSASAQTAGGEIIVIDASGPVAPAMKAYIERALETAESRQAVALIIQLNTPGGAVDTMTEIVTAIRGSQVPVVVYVAPRGAIAGSAGTVITLAGHVSAMAPETAIGAASPVGGSGEDLGETIESKLKEALRATIRSLMEGRPPEAIALAEDTIENATAATATEAFEIGMIDILADGQSDLLRQLDGRSVELAGGSTIALSTAFASVVEMPPSLIEQLLAVLTNPNIVFLLLIIGVQSILIELGSPGGWVAGFLGAVSLSLAAFGLGFLETNWLGLIFLVISFALFVLEVKSPTSGALTAAGVGTFIAGALIMFNSPGTPQFSRVSVPLVVISAALMGGLFLLVVTFAIRSQRNPVRTGQKSLIGRIGRARSSIDPDGMVQLGGEQWSARLAEGSRAIKKGEAVQVVDAKGIRLTVRLLHNDEL